MSAVIVMITASAMVAVSTTSMTSGREMPPSTPLAPYWNVTMTTASPTQIQMNPHSEIGRWLSQVGRIDSSRRWPPGRSSAARGGVDASIGGASLFSGWSGVVQVAVSVGTGVGPGRAVRPAGSGREGGAVRAAGALRGVPGGVLRGTLSGGAAEADRPAQRPVRDGLRPGRGVAAHPAGAQPQADQGLVQRDAGGDAVHHRGAGGLADRLGQPGHPAAAQADHVGA